MRWLALDVGAKKVGVALCDEAEQVVTPKATLRFLSASKLAQAVRELVAQWQVDAVLVGVPHTRSGQSPGERRVAQVVAALEQVLVVPVVTFDERGTTQEAASRLADRGLSPTQADSVIDALAAGVLLEAFLVHRKVGKERTTSDS